MDLPKGEPGSSSETRLVSSYDGNQAASIKIEENTDVKEEEDPESVTSSLIKTEHEVSYMSMCPVCPLYRYPELLRVSYRSTWNI